MTTPFKPPETVEALAAEFLDRCRQGESPTIDDYATKYPDLADTIRDLFPTIAALEGLKQDGNKRAAQRATRRPLQLQQLGDFKILREIGRGGMGIVYEAQQESLGRHVALKVLPKQALLDPAQLKRFHREARIAARLHHTNIVSIYGTGQHDGYHFLVMELVDGESLDTLIARFRLETKNASAADSSPEIQHRDVARIGHDAARALQHAHERDVLHRDIKPGNLILDSDGNIWLSDLGLAQAMEPQGAEEGNRTQTVGGTLSYMPPEVFAGQVDARSDVYSLGLTLYELLILQPAFDESNAAQAMKQITQASTPPRRPREIDASVPKDLEKIILKACEPEPTRRYSNAGEMADDLRRFLEHRPVHARRASAIEHAWRWCGRNRLVASLSAATLAMLLLLSGVMTRSFLRAESANREVKMALDREMVQRERSEQTLRVATASLNDIYRDFAPGDLPSSSTDTAEESDNDRATAALSPETAIVLENLLTFYDRLAENSGDNVSLRESSARALGRMGDIYRQLGQSQKGLDRYDDAIASLQKLVSDADDRIDNAMLTVEIARITNEIGRIHRVTGEHDLATTSHLEALQVLDELKRTADTLTAQPLAQYEQARAHYYLGRKRPVRASRVALDQLRLDDRPPRDKRRPGPPPLRSLLSGWLPNDRPSRRDAPPGGDEQRREHLTAAIDQLNDLTNSTESQPRYQFLLACCYRETPRGRENTPPQPRFSSGAGETQLPAELSSGKTRAVALLKDLVQRHPNNATYCYELAETLRHNPRRDRRSQSDQDLAAIDRQEVAWLREALDLVNTLTDRHPNVPAYAMSKMHVLHQLGHHYPSMAVKPPRKSEHKPTAESAAKPETKYEELATEALRGSRDQIQTVCRRWPNQPEYLLWSIVVDGSLAKRLHELGDNKSAATIVHSALESLDRLAEQQDIDTWLRKQLPQLRHVMTGLANRVQRRNRPNNRR